MSVTLTRRESAVFWPNAGKTRPNAVKYLAAVGKTDSAQSIPCDPPDPQLKAPAPAGTEARAETVGWLASGKDNSSGADLPLQPCVGPIIDRHLGHAYWSFIERLPTVESLMPALSYQELAGEADPPIVEQLITPNALRQQRFRERQRALRNGEVTLAVTHDDDGEDGE